MCSIRGGCTRGKVSPQRVAAPKRRKGFAYLTATTKMVTQSFMIAHTMIASLAHDISEIGFPQDCFTV